MQIVQPELLEALFRSIAEGEASEEILTADGLRRLAAEHGEKAPARIRERLRSVRLRPGDGDGVCVQQLAEELGVAFENELLSQQMGGELGKSSEDVHFG